MDKNLVFTTTVDEKESNKSIHAYLTERFTYHTGEEWQKHIIEGKITLNGEVASDFRSVISPGDTLTYTPDSFREPVVPTELEIIGSSPDFIIIGKPAGVPVSRTGIIIQNTFINLVRDRFDNPDIHLMHRLDRETSGLLLCAKSRVICKKHQQHLGKILTGKYYLAIVRGNLDVENHTINHPLSPDLESTIRCKVCVNPNGKPSQSIISTIVSSSYSSLILVKLVTGRKHQIRCHLAHLNHPVIGDKIYDHNGHYYLKRLEQELDAGDYSQLGAENHTLHAWAADIILPGEGQKLYFSKCFSADFIRYSKSFPDWLDKASAKLEQLRHP